MMPSFIIVPIAIIRASVSDELKMSYVLLLEEAYCQSGASYEQCKLSNEELSRLWRIGESGARWRLNQMRKSGWLKRHRQGQTHWIIELLITHHTAQPGGLDSSSADMPRGGRRGYGPTATWPANRDDHQEKGQQHRLGANPGLLGANPISTQNGKTCRDAAVAADSIQSDQKQQQQQSSVLARFLLECKFLAHDAETIATSAIVQGWTLSQIQQSWDDVCSRRGVHNPQGLLRTILRQLPPQVPSQSPFQEQYGDGLDLPDEAGEAAADEVSLGDGLWSATLATLRGQMSRATFDSWLRDTRARVGQDGILIVEVRNQYAQEWLTHRLALAVSQAVQQVTGQPLAIEFVVRSKDGEPNQEGE